MIVAGDIGGTRTRLALYDPGGDSARAERVYANREVPAFEDAIARFLEGAGRPEVTSMALAVAGPVLDGRVQMTNLEWTLDEATLSRLLGGCPVRLLNDLEAAAYGVLLLPADDLRTLAGGTPPSRGNVAVIAAGTGLGEALLAWHDDAPLAIASEGGHADFAPRDSIDAKLLAWLARAGDHVSWERVVSGPGLVHVFDFLRESGREEVPAGLRERLAAAVEPATVITAAGIAGEHAICVHTLEIFVRAYGAEAGNLALKAMALGGVYVAGGIAPDLLQGRWAELFLRAFTAKGRYTELLRRIPVRVVVGGNAALAGCRDVARRRIRTGA